MSPSTPPTAHNPQLPDKAFFRIGEVADLLGVEPHVVRFWQEQFPQVRPERSSTNRFVYGRSAVAKLLQIRALLYEQGYTIAGARKALTSARDSTKGPAPTPAIEPPPPPEAHKQVVELQAEVDRLQHEVKGLNARLEAAQVAERAAQARLDGDDARTRAELAAALADCDALMGMLDQR